MADHAETLFSTINFTILPSETITESKAAQIKRDLESRGASFIPLKANGSIDGIKRHTYIISDHVDFPQYDEALDEGCHVIKPSWVEQSLVKNRLAQARQHSPDPALIFQDVVITFGDLPQGDKDAIIAGVMAMGGMYSSLLTRMVTHIVTLTTDSGKIEYVMTHGLPTQIVLPHWFDDCLKLGKRIGEGPYRFPDPKILGVGSFAAQKGSQSPDIEGAVTARPDFPSAITPGSERTPFNAFQGKSICVCEDLQVHDELRKIIGELAGYAGGTITDDINHCDIFIGQYRDGPGYIMASRRREVFVGNLTWFYHIIVRKRWSNPVNKLLHYPIPRNGLKEFKNTKICLSNYTGDARLYLENVIEAAGGEFTKTLKQENTHLITAHKKSEKCDAAQEWNIHTINHLWLEESYAKGNEQSLTHSRYTHFPSNTNLSEIVGQTPIDLDAILAISLPKEDIYEDEAIQDEIDTNEHHTSEANGNGEEKDVPNSTNVLTNGDMNANVTPKTSRFASEDRPSTARASKTKAKAELEKAMEDVAEFNKEQKRKGGVLRGRKRGNEEADAVENTEVSDNVRLGKKQKTNGHFTDHNPILYRMLVTGDDRWANKSKKEADDKKTLRNLGILLTINATDCNLLCASKIVRTKKFSSAIANAPEVVNLEFLDYVLKHRKLPEDISKYYLVDNAGETSFDFKLNEALKRAVINKGKLFRGWTIYLTDKLKGGFETYKDIIEANSGSAIVYRGRTGVQLPHRRPIAAQDPDAGQESQHQGGDEETEYVYLVSSLKEEDMKIWSTFRALAAKQELKARIVSTDWLLNAAIIQEIRWRDEWQCTEEVAAMANGDD